MPENVIATMLLSYTGTQSLLIELAAQLMGGWLANPASEGFPVLIECANWLTIQQSLINMLLVTMNSRAEG